jgi:hypothetical protein
MVRRGSESSHEIRRGRWLPYTATAAVVAARLQSGPFPPDSHREIVVNKGARQQRKVGVAGAFPMLERNYPHEKFRNETLR